MSLVLTRKADQSVRLIIERREVFLDVEHVTDRDCLMAVRMHDNRYAQRVRFRGEMQIAEGVTVTVLDLAKGHAKLGFDAPRDVHILRTELIKEKEA